MKFFFNALIHIIRHLKFATYILLKYYIKVIKFIGNKRKDRLFWNSISRFVISPNQSHCHQTIQSAERRLMWSWTWRCSVIQYNAFLKVIIIEYLLVLKLLFNSILRIIYTIFVQSFENKRSKCGVVKNVKNLCEKYQK